MLKDFATSIVRTLHGHGHKAYLVGGCVRDLLLGREPSDYDVATDALPEEVIRIFPETYAVGAQFGVVLVPLPEQELQRLSDQASRSQSSVSTTQLAEVPPTEPSAIRDAASVATDHPKANAVEVATFRSDIGYSDGRHPEKRFAEDKLRMLRAVRFAARFGYKIDPATFNAIQKLAAQIHQVSRERLRDELTKMLTEGRAREAFLLLDESGLLQQVLPEI